MKNKGIIILSVIFLLVASILVAGCSGGEAQSRSGVSAVTVKVPTGPDGFTTEQRDITKRLIEDNKPGAIKHLYVISAYSGQVILYSTVDGKVTSSGKRLAPYNLVGETGSGYGSWFDINIGGNNYRTAEVLQDDGTYGTSEPYIYWWDTKGVYHQHYVSGGQIIHVSNQPIAVKSIVINLEQQNATA
jgi:uncharacterized protein YcfL